MCVWARGRERVSECAGVWVCDLVSECLYPRVRAQAKVPIALQLLTCFPACAESNVQAQMRGVSWYLDG